VRTPLWMWLASHALSCHPDAGRSRHPALTHVRLLLLQEKYVNLNYLGFHKAVKKHDKQLPHAPCQQFYMHVLRNQPWVQGTSPHHT
jgi:SPX domain protein involved in polyphosphate accumulation